MTFKRECKPSKIFSYSRLSVPRHVQVIPMRNGHLDFSVFASDNSDNIEDEYLPFSVKYDQLAILENKTEYQHNCLGTDHRSIVKIQLTGSRELDFDKANKESDLHAKPDGYTWHHLYRYYNHPEGYLELVNSTYHRSIQHKGGCSLYGTHRRLKEKDFHYK